MDHYCSSSLAKEPKNPSSTNSIIVQEADASTIEVGAVRVVGFAQVQKTSTKTEVVPSSMEVQNWVRLVSESADYY